MSYIATKKEKIYTLEDLCYAKVHFKIEISVKVNKIASTIYKYDVVIADKIHDCTKSPTTTRCLVIVWEEYKLKKKAMEIETNCSPSKVELKKFLIELCAELKEFKIKKVNYKDSVVMFDNIVIKKNKTL